MATFPKGNVFRLALAWSGALPYLGCRRTSRRFGEGWRGSRRSSRAHARAPRCRTPQPPRGRILSPGKPAGRTAVVSFPPRLCSLPFARLRGKPKAPGVFGGSPWTCSPTPKPSLQPIPWSGAPPGSRSPSPTAPHGSSPISVPFPSHPSTVLFPSHPLQLSFAQASRGDEPRDGAPSSPPCPLLAGLVPLLVALSPPLRGKCGAARANPDTRLETRESAGKSAGGDSPWSAARGQPGSCTVLYSTRRFGLSCRDGMPGWRWEGAGEGLELRGHVSPFPGATSAATSWLGPDQTAAVDVSQP